MISKREIIITAGSKYVDIDVLACGVAYSQLLNLFNIKNSLVLTGPFNQTVPSFILNWQFDIKTLAPSKPFDFDYVLVDVSDPKFFEGFVVLDQVVKVFDHHDGFKEYWHKLIAQDCAIEHVGSCATLIWDEYVKHDKSELISPLSANLIGMSIVSNTLNFRASTTNDKDIKAFEDIKKFMSLETNWIANYYECIEQDILTDPLTSIKNDTKRLNINGIDYTIAQIELWDPRKFLDCDIMDIAINALNVDRSESHWFLTICGIYEEINYFITDNTEVKYILCNALPNINFNGNIGKSQSLFMRKQIIKALIQNGIQIQRI